MTNITTGKQLYNPTAAHPIYPSGYTLSLSLDIHRANISATRPLTTKRMQFSLRFGHVTPGARCRRWPTTPHDTCIDVACSSRHCTLYVDE